MTAANCQTSKGLALVTGGSRGIGRAIAKRLARDGFSVAFTYLSNAESAADVVREISAAGGRAKAFRCDISKFDQINELFSALDAEEEPLHTVVSNAAHFSIEPLELIDEANLGSMFAANLNGPIFLSKLADPRLSENGRLIFISSVAAREASPAYLGYAATKAGLGALVRGLASLLGPRGITVNAIAPGLTDTDMTLILKATAPVGTIEAVIERTALRRIGQPQDIADAVALLASEDSRWITGQVIDCSGGYGL